MCVCVCVGVLVRKLCVSVCVCVCEEALTEFTQKEVTVLSFSLYTTLHSGVETGGLSCDLSYDPPSSSSTKLLKLREGD